MAMKPAVANATTAAPVTGILPLILPPRFLATVGLLT